MPMVDKICDNLMNKIKEKMPEVDDERAEVIRYGLELMFGEVPKLLIMIIIATLLGILKYFCVSVLIICSYRIFAGGVHLKSHIGCIIGTNILYIGNVYISKYIYFFNIYNKILFASVVLLFSMIVISLNIPADTISVPILRKKDRLVKKICSYIIVIFSIIISFYIKDKIISNMCIIGILLQSITTTRIIYSIFNVKFGYIEYMKKSKKAI